MSPDDLDDIPEMTLDQARRVLAALGLGGEQG